MKLAKATLAGLACVLTVNAGGLPAQIYVHPALSSSKPVSLTAGEANAVLSHRLGISTYETLPKGLTAGSKKGQIVFGDARGEIGEQQKGPKVVMVVYGSDGRGPSPLPASRGSPTDERAQRLCRPRSDRSRP